MKLSWYQFIFINVINVCIWTVTMLIRRKDTLAAGEPNFNWCYSSEEVYRSNPRPLSLQEARIFLLLGAEVGSGGHREPVQLDRCRPENDFVGFRIWKKVLKL